MPSLSRLPLTIPSHSSRSSSTEPSFLDTEQLPTSQLIHTGLCISVALLFRFVPHALSPPCPQPVLYICIYSLSHRAMQVREKNKYCVLMQIHGIQKRGTDECSFIFDLLKAKQAGDGMEWDREPVKRESGSHLLSGSKPRSTLDSHSVTKNDQLCIDQSFAYIKATTPGPRVDVSTSNWKQFPFFLFLALSNSQNPMTQPSTPLVFFKRILFYRISGGKFSFKSPSLNLPKDVLSLIERQQPDNTPLSGRQNTYSYLVFPQVTDYFCFVITGLSTS